MIRLLATDLDGTLLNNEFKVSPANAEAIKKALQMGVIVTFATGRMYASAVLYAKQIGIDVPIITYNGALIKSAAGKVYFEKFLAEDAVRDVIEYCQNNNYHIQLYQDDILYFPVRNKRAAAYEKAAGVKGREIGWEGLLEHTQRVAKMLCIAQDEGQRMAISSYINENFAGRVKAVRSNYNFVEIIRPDIDKAVALRALAGNFGIDIKDTAAIGDSGNDLPMLKAAGFSVAVANAADEVKQSCDYVTVSNEENALAAILEKCVFKPKEGENNGKR